MIWQETNICQENEKNSLGQLDNYGTSGKNKSHLQLCEVDIGGIEREADGEGELGVHQQGHLVLRLLHSSLLRRGEG